MNPEILDRLPPQNLDAERQTLGCAILQPNILDELSSLVTPDDFHADANRRLYGHLLGMTQIDASLLIDRLRSSGDLEAIGGTAYLAEVIQSVATAAHWRNYAAIVRRDSQKRQIIHAALEAVRDAYDPASLSEEILASLELDLGRVKTGTYDTDPVSMDVACVAALNHVRETAERQSGGGYMIGLPDFDETIGGLFRGELVIVAGRPGQGKTSLALQMASRIASRGHRVYFATLEMGRVEIALKRLCSVSGVSNQAVRTGSVNHDEMRRLVEAGNEVGLQNFFLHDWPQIRPYDVERAARRLNAEVVFVDYLQIVTPPDKRKQRYEQVGEIANQFKVMARRLNVPVVACAQIGRQAMQHKESPPKLEHLRESGNIENECDMALLLWRPKEPIQGTGRYEGLQWDAELEVAKNRKGVPGCFRLSWNGDVTTFSCHSALPVASSGKWDPDGWINT